MKYVDKYVLLEQKEYERLLSKLSNMEGRGSEIKASESPLEKLKEEVTPEKLKEEAVPEKLKEEAGPEKREDIIDQLKSASAEEDELDKEAIKSLQSILKQDSERKPTTTSKASKNIKSKRPPPPPGIPDKKRKITPNKKHEWTKFWNAN